VSAIDLPHARRLAYGVVLGQALVSAALGLGAWLLFGARAGGSALLGGAIATAGSLAMAGLGLTGAAAGDAQRALGAFYLGEAVKIAVVIGLFVVVLKSMRVVPLAMFAAFAATFLVYWIALLAALPKTGSAGGGAGRVG
jgi:ATP synthase protein I